MQQANDSSGRLRFGVFEVDLRAGELTKRGRRIRLQEQPFQVLAMLLGKPGELVTREELREKIWGQTIVDFDHGLNKAINKIREALGDSAENPRFVETVARRGYRFLADVTPIDTVADSQPGPKTEDLVPPADSHRAGLADSECQQGERTGLMPGSFSASALPWCSQRRCPGFSTRRVNPHPRSARWLCCPWRVYRATHRRIISPMG
jgi:DNA-binding winged helix-turn-helix (wHTH) protein